MNKKAKTKVLHFSILFIVLALSLMLSSAGDSPESNVEKIDYDANIKTITYKNITITSPRVINCKWTDPNADWKLCEVEIAVTNHDTTHDFTEKDSPFSKFKHDISDMEVYTSPLDYTYEDTILNLTCFDLLNETLNETEQEEAIQDNSTVCRYNITRYSFNDWKLKTKLDKFPKGKTLGIKLIFKTPILIDAGNYQKNQFNFTLFGEDYDITLDPDISDCAVLSTDGATYTLTANISNSTTSNCINITGENVTLDCRNNIIDGNDAADHGIVVKREASNITNTTIRNCELIDWDTQNIYLRNADSNTLINITSTSSPDNGIYISGSDSNTLTSVTTNSNYDYGIYLYYSDNNTLTNVTANSNGQDGIFVQYSNNNTLTNVTANSYNDDGIYLSHSKDNTFTNVTANDNDHYGIWFASNSDSNTLTDITANSNGYAGIHLWSSADSNVLTNITANSNSMYGIYLHNSNNNTLIDMKLTNNTYYDFKIVAYSASYCNHNLTNITGTDDKPIVYYNSAVTIEHCDNNVSEIVLCNADKSIIYNVTMSHTDKENNGILLAMTDNTNLTNVSVSDSYDGIYLDYSKDNTFTNITANNNSQYGIHFYSSSDSNVLTNITANSNGYAGIILSSSNSNTLTNVTANSNVRYGVYLWSSDSNILTNVTANSNEDYGIRLYGSSNTINDSKFWNNSDAGIFFDGASSNSNLIYNNLFNNTVNFDYSGIGANSWNTTKQTGNRIISNGTEIGGNYWANLTGDGYSETCTDDDVDGFCDTAYTLAPDNIDYLPLSDEYSIITDCSDLNEAGKTYLLKANISNSTTSNCINITAENITLDCRNNIIDGNDEADYGIRVYRDSVETTNVTIRNCEVIDWDSANVYLRRANSNTLINITSTSSPSGDEGIWLNDADSNTLTYVTTNSNGGSGIYLGTDSDFNTLTNITANSNDFGIYFYFADSNTLTNITTNSNSLYGIWIYGADSNTFTNTTANNNSYSGIYFLSADNNIFKNTTADNNSQYGIYLSSSTSNTFNNVTANNNSYSGIYFLTGSGNNIFTNVTANDNEQNGIYISGSGNNIFKNVTANSNNWHGIRVGTYSDSNNFINITANSNTEYGIFLWSSDSNTINESEFWNNTQGGVYSYGDSNSNLIYNNLFNNTLNFDYSGIGNNSWNTTKQAGTNIVGQGWIGGNYWANPTGDGYSDTCWDRTGDYICEDSYTLAVDNIDYLPLTSNSDTIAPTIPNVSISPNTAASLDPYVQINVTANITDATSGVNTTILQYKFHSAPTFINVTMRYNSTTKLYNASFTPDAEGEWTYRVWANDTANSIYNTTATNVSVYKDYTWVRSPADAGTILGILTTTKEILNLTINNTGDYSLDFALSDTAPYGSGYNSSTTFSIASDGSKTIAFDATFGSTTREDAVVITIDSTTPNADPSETTTNFTLASYAGGPFFDVVIDTYPASINQSRTAIIRAYVKNIGNETSIQTWLNWTLPSGVTNTTGNTTQNVTLNETSNLTSGLRLYNTLNITVNESTVEIGLITIYAKATGFNSTNGKISKEANKTITITCYSGDGVCGKGCNYHTDTDCEVPQNVTTTTTAAGGGGGGVPFVFKAEVTYELVRGRDQIFILPLKNTYSSKTLTNIRVSASGYLAQYIKIEPPENVSANETGEIKVKILAPSYFTVGMHNLTFTIQSVAKEKGTSDISRTEKRYVYLSIHELGKGDSEKLINEIENYLNKLKKLNLKTEGIQELFDKSLDAINKSNYEKVNEMYEQSKELAEAAFDSYSIVKGLEEKLNDTSKYGIKTPKTDRLISLAKSALERGDYLLALERVKDAQLTYIIETKGKFGLIYYIRKNTFEFFLYTIAILILLTVLYFRTRISVINYNLKNFQQEEDTLLGLMRVVQKECFEEKKMSMNEYNDAMLQYEDRLSKAVQKTIQLEASKANLLKFKHRKLELERKRLLDLMKITQEKYLNEGAIETQVYNNKMHSFVSRLSELEENLALQEAKQTLRKRKLFWRVFYSVFQPKSKDKKD